jgi:membrane protein
MSKRKITASASIAIVVVVAVVLSTFLRKPRRNEQDIESTAVSTSNQAKSALSEEESGDSFNTDDLDTGIAKEGRSTGGLAHGVDETEASTEASEPETYAEKDADGRNLTEPAQISNVVATDVSKKVREKVMAEDQNTNNVNCGNGHVWIYRIFGCTVILLFLFMLWKFLGALFKKIRENKNRLILLTIILLICISLELFSKLGILPLLFSTIIMGALLKDCSDYIFNIKKIKERTAYERSKGNGFNEDYFNLVVNHYMLALKLIVPSSVISFSIVLKLLELPFFKKIDTVVHYGTEIISLLIGMFVGLGLYCFIEDKDVDKLINRRGWNFHPYTPEEKKIIVGLPVESHCFQSDCESSDEKGTEVTVDKKEMNEAIPHTQSLENERP